MRGTAGWRRGNCRFKAPGAHAPRPLGAGRQQARAPPAPPHRARVCGARAACGRPRAAGPAGRRAARRGAHRPVVVVRRVCRPVLDVEVLRQADAQRRHERRRVTFYEHGVPQAALAQQLACELAGAADLGVRGVRGAWRGRWAGAAGGARAGARAAGRFRRGGQVGSGGAQRGEGGPPCLAVTPGDPRGLEGAAHRDVAVFCLESYQALAERREAAAWLCGLRRAFFGRHGRGACCGAAGQGGAAATRVAYVVGAQQQQASSFK